MNMKRLCAILLIIALILSVPAAMASSAQAKRAVSIAKGLIGRPYKLNSNAPSSFNCATFVKYCVNKVQSGRLSNHGVNGSYKKVRSMRKLKVGDIVCYRISNPTGVKALNYHVGLYCGKGYMIHASRTAGRVIMSKVSSYSGRYLGAIRVF